MEIIATVVIGLIVFSMIWEWLGEHMYFTISALIVIAVLIFGGWRIALGVGVLLIAVRYAVPKIMNWISEVQKQIAQKHEAQLMSWLRENCAPIPSISIDMLLNESDQVHVPEIFKQYEYPNGKTFEVIVTSFVSQMKEKHRDHFLSWLNQNCRTLGRISVTGLLNQPQRVAIPEIFKQYTYPYPIESTVRSFLQKCDTELEAELEERVYDEFYLEGMMDRSEIERKVIADCSHLTHTKILSDLCSAATNRLIANNQLVQPIKDQSNVLRCAGVVSGRNFESEELDIEI